jgi:response regulator of citrate/malate metabolism
MPSGKGQGKRGLDAASLRSIAEVIEREYEAPIEEGQDGWFSVATIAEELGVSKTQARGRIHAMVSRGQLETKQARVLDTTGRLIKCNVYRARA